MEIMSSKDDKTLPELPVEISEGVWFKQDNVFFTPKAQVSLFLYYTEYPNEFNLYLYFFLILFHF